MRIGIRLMTVGLGVLLLAGCIQYSVAPSETTVHPSDSFTVDIQIGHCLQVLGKTHCLDVGNYYGAGFDLNYDPEIIRFQNISVAGSVWSGTTAVTGFRNSSTDNGKLVVGISKQAQVAGQLTDGTIAIVTFQAIGAGSTRLDFADPHLVDNQGNILVGWPSYQAILQGSTVSVVP